MPIAIAAFVAAMFVAATAWLGAGSALAAPVPLTGTASHQIAESMAPAATNVAKRYRKAARRTVRKNCGWQCKRYYRPYQYRYWKFYYPFGGPLFYGRK